MTTDSPVKFMFVTQHTFIGYEEHTVLLPETMITAHGLAYDFQNGEEVVVLQNNGCGIKAGTRVTFLYQQPKEKSLIRECCVQTSAQGDPFSIHFVPLHCLQKLDDTNRSWLYKPLTIVEAIVQYQRRDIHGWRLPFMNEAAAQAKLTPILPHVKNDTQPFLFSSERLALVDRMLRSHLRFEPTGMPHPPDEFIDDFFSRVYKSFDDVLPLAPAVIKAFPRARRWCYSTDGAIFLLLTQLLNNTGIKEGDHLLLALSEEDGDLSFDPVSRQECLLLSVQQALARQRASHDLPGNI